MPNTRKDDTSSVQEVGTQTLGTLVASTGILIAGPTVTRGGTMLSVRGAMSVHDVTPGDGPWLFGVMSSDLTLAQLEAYLEQGGPVSPADQSAREISSRGKRIRMLGLAVPMGDGSVAGEYMKNEKLSGLRFSESGEVTGAGWTWWLYNRGKTMTTGSTWRLTTSSFCRWNPSG